MEADRGPCAGLMHTRAEVRLAGRARRRGDRAILSLGAPAGAPRLLARGGASFAVEAVQIPCRSVPRRDPAPGGHVAQDVTQRARRRPVHAPRRATARAGDTRPPPVPGRARPLGVARQRNPGRLSTWRGSSRLRAGGHYGARPGGKRAPPPGAIQRHRIATATGGRAIGLTGGSDTGGVRRPAGRTCSCSAGSPSRLQGSRRRLLTAQGIGCKGRPPRCGPKGFSGFSVFWRSRGRPGLSRIRRRGSRTTG